MKGNETIGKFQGEYQSSKETWNQIQYEVWSFKISANKGAGGPLSQTIG